MDNYLLLLLLLVVVVKCYNCQFSFIIKQLKFTFTIFAVLCTILILDAFLKLVEGLKRFSGVSAGPEKIFRTL